MVFIGTADGTLTARFDGLAHTTFLKNRIGLSLTHPIPAFCGRPVHLWHTGGEQSQTQFPVEIAKWPIFTELCGMSFPIAPGIEAKLTFEGETFETEDQRNWYDGSFKTYCTPLSQPFPAEVAAGTRISQVVRLSLNGVIDDAVLHRRPAKDREALVEIGAQPLPLPRLGVSAASHGQPLAESEIERLRALNLDHLRVEIMPSEAGWKELLHLRIREARALGLPLQAVLFLGEQAESKLAELAEALAAEKPDIDIWLIYHTAEKHTTAKWVGLARQALSPLTPQALFGGGSNVYYADFARADLPLDLLEVVSFPVNPQAHGFDDQTIVEGQVALKMVLEDARRSVGKRLIAVTPITLRPVFYSPHTADDPRLGPLPRKVDPRQISLFTAAWLFASLRQFADGGADSLTYFETTGWRGLMETAAGSPNSFPSFAKSVFPAYFILRQLGELKGGRALPTSVSAPLELCAFAAERSGLRRLWIGNLLAKAQRVQVRGLLGTLLVRRMNAANIIQGMHEPERFAPAPEPLLLSPSGEAWLTLEPYEIIWIDQN
jgi:hypothetical protein